MTNDEILTLVRAGGLVRVGSKLYTPAQIAAIQAANDKVDDFELQQMSKKRTLRY